MNWADSAVQAAVIQTIGGVIAATIASVCAVLVGQQFVSRKRLQEKLHLAQQDIAYLLGVEEAHCQLHKQNGDSSFKLRIRREVEDKGLVWSGRFTPGRVKGQSTHEH